MKIMKLAKKEFKLSNNGELQVYFMGVGGAFSIQNKHSNFFIVKGKDHIMVDFGWHGPNVLNEMKLKPNDISNILITHSHSDHVGGLEYIAQFTRYVGGGISDKTKRPNLIVTDEYKDILWAKTLSGGLEKADKMRDLTIDDYFNIITPKHKGDSFFCNVGDISIELFRTNHVPQSAKSQKEAMISYGIVIDDKVYVSGDSKYDPDLIQKYSYCNTMFHDAGFIDKDNVHAFIGDLKKLPKNIKEKMFLYHLSDDFMDKNHDISDFAGWTEKRKIYTIN